MHNDELQLIPPYIATAALPPWPWLRSDRSSNMSGSGTAHVTEGRSGIFVFSHCHTHHAIWWPRSLRPDALCPNGPQARFPSRFSSRTLRARAPAMIVSESIVHNFPSERRLLTIYPFLPIPVKGRGQTKRPACSLSPIASPPHPSCHHMHNAICPWEAKRAL